MVRTVVEVAVCGDSVSHGTRKAPQRTSSERGTWPLCRSVPCPPALILSMYPLSHGTAVPERSSICAVIAVILCWGDNSPSGPRPPKIWQEASVGGNTNWQACLIREAVSGRDGATCAGAQLPGEPPHPGLPMEEFRQSRHRCNDRASSDRRPISARSAVLAGRLCQSGEQLLI